MRNKSVMRCPAKGMQRVFIISQRPVLMGILLPCLSNNVSVSSDIACCLTLYVREEENMKNQFTVPIHTQTIGKKIISDPQPIIDKLTEFRLFSAGSCIASNKGLQQFNRC